MYSNVPHKKDIIFSPLEGKTIFDGVVVGNIRTANTYPMIMKKKALWTHGKCIFCQSKSLHHIIHTSGLTSWLNSTSKAVVKPNKFPMWCFIYITLVKYSQRIFKVQFHISLGLPLPILIWEAFEPKIFELRTFWGGKSKQFTSLWIWVAVDVCGRLHLTILATYIQISHFWGDLASEKREIKAFKVMWMLSTQHPPSSCD